MARAGMGNLIAKVRQASSAGTADHTVAGVTYWTDDQIQEVLDRTQMRWKRVQLISLPVYADGDFTYTEYRIPNLRYFEEDNTDSGWALKDSTGADAPGYSVNYEAAVITFDADTDNLDYYLDCRTYDFNRAVADIWEQKAAFVAAHVDWSSDNHSVKASQEAAAYMRQAKKYKQLAGIQVGKMIRTDENVNPFSRST